MKLLLPLIILLSCNVFASRDRGRKNRAACLTKAPSSWSHSKKREICSDIKAGFEECYEAPPTAGPDKNE